MDARGPGHLRFPKHALSAKGTAIGLGVGAEGDLELEARVGVVELIAQ
jgi:hypothetical protein